MMRLSPRLPRPCARPAGAFACDQRESAPTSSTSSEPTMMAQAAPRPSRQQGGSPNLPSLQKMREAILDRMGFSEADRPALGHSPVSVFPNAQSSSGPSLGSTGPLDRQPYRPPILSNVTLIKIIPRIAQRTLINLAIEDAMTGEESSCKKCFPQTAS